MMSKSNKSIVIRLLLLIRYDSLPLFAKGFPGHTMNPEQITSVYIHFIWIFPSSFLDFFSLPSLTMHNLSLVLFA